jgi:hypothetical protein
MVHPLNHSTIFLKTKDMILNNYVWRIVLDLNLRPYEQVIFTLRQDLRLAQNTISKFTFVKELKQVDILLNTLETNLNYLEKFLPKLDPRRVLLNVSGVLLKSLFGTATVSDLHSLHDILDHL